MRRWHWLVVAVLILGVVAGGCAMLGRKTVRISENDANRSIELRSGDRLEVALAGNPSTGYMWQVAATDTAILRQVGEPSFTAPRDRAGAGGVLTFCFEAGGAGRTLLRLAYRQPWEKTSPPAKTFELTVVVR